MTYTKQSWADGTAGLTPISADRLNHIEDGLFAAATDASTAVAAMPPPGTDLTAMIAQFTGNFSSAQLYREPTSTEKTNGVAGLIRIAIPGADATSLLTPLGFTLTSGVDSVSKKSYVMAYSEFGTDRGWGLYLVDVTNPIRLVVGCPHPVSALYSADQALQHWQQVPGTLLMLAGAHRDAQSGLADVSLHAGSMFAGVAAAFSAMKLPQVYYDGFPDASATTQIVLTAGAAAQGSAFRRVASELTSAGLTVDSTGTVSGLTGTTNVESINAQSNNSTFVLVNTNLTTRTDPIQKAIVASAVEAGSVETLAFADGALPLASTAPSSVGSSNAVGTGVFAARNDHTHADNPATLTRITNVETGLSTAQSQLTAATTLIGGAYTSNAQQTVAASGATRITFGGALQAASGITWNGSNTFTVVTAGLYSAYAGVGTGFSSTGNWGVGIHNSSSNPAAGTAWLSAPTFGDGQTSSSTATTLYLTAGATLCAYFYNNENATRVLDPAVRPAVFRVWRVG